MERTIDAGPGRGRGDVPTRTRTWFLAALLGWQLLGGPLATVLARDVEPNDAEARTPSAGVSLPGGLDLDVLGSQARLQAQWAGAWYSATPPAERITWGGLVAAASLALGVVLERSVRLRRRRIVPDEFPARFLERLQDGRLDRGKAQDYCELNPSPAARVALAAVKRWGRPVVDLDRAVVLAHRVEVERIRRHVGTLRRVAALAPLIGLLGTLTALGRILGGLGAGATAGVWGPALAAALGPLTAGVALATLALVAYDGLAGKVEHHADALDRIGAETIDAIALATPLVPPSQAEVRPGAPSPAGPAQSHGPHTPMHNHGHGHPPLGTARSTGHIRMEIPRPAPRPMLDDDDLD